MDLNGNCSGSNVAHCKAGTFCDVQGRCSKWVHVVTIILFGFLIGISFYSIFVYADVGVIRHILDNGHL